MANNLFDKPKQQEIQEPVELCVQCKKNPKLRDYHRFDGKLISSPYCAYCNQTIAWRIRAKEYGVKI